MSGRWWMTGRAPGAEGDPGGAWAAEVLRPLRGLTVQCDVASRVMSRIAADQRTAARPWRTPRLAWASSLLLAGACLAFVVAGLVLVVTGGGSGAYHQVTGLALSFWHVFQVFGRLIADLGSRVVTALLPLLRAFLTLLEVMSPILRGAGLLAATGGILSILFSVWVFASARNTAPRVNFHGGIR